MKKTIPYWLDGKVEMSPQEWLVKRSRCRSIENEKRKKKKLKKKKKKAWIDRARSKNCLITAADRFDESQPDDCPNRSAQLEDISCSNIAINENKAVNSLGLDTKLPTLQKPHSFSALSATIQSVGTQVKLKTEKNYPKSASGSNPLVD